MRAEQVAGPRLDISVAPRVHRSQGQGSLVRANLPPRQGSPSSPPISSRRTIPVQRSRRRGRQEPGHEPQVWEMACHIGVNVLFTVAALSGLYRLLPVQLAQHHRLQVLERHIEVLSTRISRLQEGVDRGMDPLQQEALIKERLNRVPPNQIQVRLVDPSTLVADDEKDAPLPGSGSPPSRLPGRS
ncbi:slr1601 family putative cell division protein [Thermostichus sp. OS-CIW-30]